MRELIDWKATPDGVSYIRKALQEILEPIYGDQGTALKKVLCGQDRNCKILFENGFKAGILIYKTHTTNEFSTPNAFEIKSLFLTDQKYSNRGLASQLLASAALQATKLDASSLYVRVNSSCPDSLIFFLKKGFIISQTALLGRSFEYTLFHSNPGALIQSLHYLKAI